MTDGRVNRLHGAHDLGQPLADLFTEFALGGRPRCKACGHPIKDDQERGAFWCGQGCTDIVVDHVSPYADDEV